MGVGGGTGVCKQHKTAVVMAGYFAWAEGNASDIHHSAKKDDIPFRRRTLVCILSEGGGGGGNEGQRFGACCVHNGTWLPR